MKPKVYLDDWAAPAADVNLTAHLYTRINASYTKWMLLEARLKIAKKIMGIKN